MKKRVHAIVLVIAMIFSMFGSVTFNVEEAKADTQKKETAKKTTSKKTEDKEETKKTTTKKTTTKKATSKEEAFDENKPLIKQIDIPNIKTYDDVIEDYESSEEENAVISAEELEKRTRERMEK